MDELYRILGKEHEADLDREARKWRRAAEVRGQRRVPATVPEVQTRGKPVRLGPPRLIAFVMRAARA